MSVEANARIGERMARFEREAQVLASLNHPNIAAYQPTADGQRFFVNASAGEETTPPPLTVVLHWQSGVRK